MSVTEFSGFSYRIIPYSWGSVECCIVTDVSEQNENIITCISQKSVEHAQIDCRTCTKRCVLSAMITESLTTTA